MNFTVSITSQGQISIPIAFRRKLKLEKYSQALVTEKNGKLYIEPVKDLLELEGIFKTKKKPLTGQEIHELSGQALAEDFSKSEK